jgi:muconolactone delta-isomerase
MLYFVDIEVDAKGLTMDELWDLWEQEVAAARQSKDVGLIDSLYKVAGQRRVVGVLDVPDHETLDRVFMAGLPMADYLLIREIAPVRQYFEFGDDVKARWQADAATTGG